jgi:hypothetical protein
MKYLACLAIAATIGTMLIATNAGALDRYRTGSSDVTARVAKPEHTPTWTPTWSPTWTPAPQLPEPSPTYHAYPDTGGCLSEAEVASLVSAAGFPAELVPTMVEIGKRESGLCAGAVNPISGACGIFQLYECPGPDALDPARNAVLAYQKYVNAGYSLSPWAMTAP